MTINRPFLDDETASDAISAIEKLARDCGVNWAMVDGLAMILYGSDRLTKDIDVIASALLPEKFQIVGPLRQGGRRYEIPTKKRTANVDWIIRNDGFKAMFDEALDESVQINGVPVITPVWLVILKFIAGRFKDQEDAVFLLSRPGLSIAKLSKRK